MEASILNLSKTSCLNIITELAAILKPMVQEPDQIFTLYEIDPSETNRKLANAARWRWECANYVVNVSQTICLFGTDWLDNSDIKSRTLSIINWAKDAATSNYVLQQKIDLIINSFPYH